MTEIPKIAFSPKGKSKTIDFINLEALMARKNLTTNHSPFEFHRLDFNLLLIFTGDSVNHKIDFKQFTLKKNDILLLTKGQVHSFGKRENYKGHIILFNDEFLLKHLSHSAAQQLDVLRPFHLSSPKYIGNSEILDCVTDIESFWKDQGRLFFEDMLANKLIKLLFQVQTQQITSNEIPKESNHDTRNKLLFFQFNAHIQNSGSISRNAQSYAEKLAITYKVLNTICKKITGLTAKEYIDQIVILEAKRRIATNTATILETALLCGFDDATNFSKYFKKQTGLTPGKFKSKFFLGRD